ncbi:hypothetical protein [Ornithinimicrobium sp. INDO-MA30-4]|uniref:hypothetical protein n=1 Tax=Ornithinimicrobium sp. INDO-MA30-4 TaxID=2908651 RepID=UPI001F396E57|nr:hypothetical protein [Ornithinimicrobium sp. INDO-MA30-4]UJH70265.1 hypothetical protein L0A91_14075 [Ornithinimicrobium sp. INDO-MA30-4]
MSQGEAPETVTDLEGLVIGASPAGALTLDDVADVESVDELVRITRIDGQRSASITAVPTGDNLGALTADLTQRLADLDGPRA